MIHADVNVAVIFREPLDDVLEQLQFHFSGRQDFLLQNLLRRFHPRHMRVTEHGQAIGRHRYHAIERAVKRFDGLKWQAVN